jgi:hypothetical protein
MPNRIHAQRRAGGAVVPLMLAAVWLLTGCSATAKDAGPAPSVASVATEAAAKTSRASGSSAAPDKERLYFRPDMTDDEEIRLQNMYESCLIDHGVPAAVKGKQVKAWDDGTAKYADARKACQGKKAELYQEHLAQVDPAAFQDYLRISLACVKAGGIKATMNAAGNGFDIDPKTPVEKALKVQGDCEMKAYNETK